MEPVLGLLVFRIVLGKSWPKLSRARTQPMVLSSRRAGSSICVCSPAVWVSQVCVYTVPGPMGSQLGWWGASTLVHWKDRTPRRVLTRMGPVLCRKQPKRVRAPPRLGGPRPREGKRLFPGHPVGPRQAGLVYLPLSPWVCVILWGGVHSVTPLGLRRLFTWVWGWVRR